MDPQQEMIKKRLDRIEQEQDKLKQLIEKLRVAIESAPQNNGDNSTCCKLEDFFHATHLMRALMSSQGNLYC